MRKEIDNIEIQEPPIEKLSKKRSCFKRTCMTGCSLIVLLFILSIILLRFTLGPRTRELKDLPDHFNEKIPVYDTENIEKIKYTAGKDRGKNAEIVAYIPKTIIAPITLLMGKNQQPDDKRSNWKKMWEFIKEPITDKRDIIKIEWTMLPTDPEFLIDYYKKELEKTGFKITLETKSKTTWQFTFENEITDGLLYIYDKDETAETDFMSISLNTSFEEGL